MNDLKLAFRQLLKNPGFTAVAVLTLALGISANTTIFSIISAMFFQPLPVKDPDQLVLVLQKSALWNMPHGNSWLDYREYRERVDGFADVLALMFNPAHLSIPGQQPERTWIEAVSGNYFSMLGVETQMGRLFRADEGNKPGADPVIVLSYDYWQRKFGGDRSVVGRTMALNGRLFTVIGVAPQSFNSAQWSMAPAAFVPASMLGQVREGGENLLKDRGAPAFKTMARLKPGVTLGQARAAVDRVAKQLAQEFPEEHKQSKVTVVPERYCRPEPTFSEFMPLVSSVFMAMVLLVLLIACANVANLMFSRAIVRQKEMGIRSAIGATRWRLLRQLLAESVVLALLAGVVGCLFAFWSAELLSGFTPAGDVPVRTERHWDWRVFAFTFVLSILAGIVTAIAPALRATQLDLQSTLKEGGAALLSSGRHRFRSVLVVSQVAICVIVLIAGGLFVRSLQQVARLNLGFRTDHLLMASLDLGLQGYTEAKQKQFCTELIERVNALPAVRSASMAATVPFDFGFDIAQVAPEEKAGDKRNFSSAHVNRVDADYFPTMGTPLQRGRNFGRQDKENAPKVAIINGVMAERIWPGQDALGKRFQWGANGEMWQVVGIAPTGKYVMIGEEPRPFFYVPLAQRHVSPLTLHVWIRTEPSSATRELMNVLRKLDPNLPVYNVRTMGQHLHDSAFAMMPLRMGATLAGVQGLLGLFLAVMGIYGVVSYVVSQRTREIGIRMALGARKLDIFRLVIRDGLKLTVIGLAIGLLFAAAVSGIFGQILHGLSPAAAPVFVAVIVVLGAVSLLACYLPARRATGVHPTEALRCE